MPQVKSVKSLSETCVDFILHDENDFCRKIGLDSVNIEKNECSPFDYLPTAVLEELAKIFMEMEKKKHTSRITKNGFFELLITPHLRTLDLKHWRGNCNVLQLASLRSPHIETLLLGYYCNRKYPREFLNCLPKFSKLKSLDISFSGAGDDCLQLLGIYCKDLRELYARNSDISDDGIQELCVIGNSKSICVIVLEGSKVTSKGIQLALSNLPELQVLYHESIVECLANIAQTALDEKLNMPKYSLSVLYILENTTYQSASLNLSLLLCPKVTNLHVSWKNGKLTDDDLLSLLSLNKLETLEIEHYAFLPGILRQPIDTGLTFERGIAPLLRTHGNSLKRLILKGFFVDVDISVIINSCPNLQSLNLAVIGFKTSNIEVRINQQPVFKQLAILNLDGSVTTKNLSTFLFSPSLVYVRLSNCSTLTDEVLRAASHQHSFLNLKNFKLFHCPSVTKIGIDVLLKNNNPLNEIHLIGCGNIKHNFTINKNLDLLTIHGF